MKEHPPPKERPAVGSGPIQTDSSDDSQRYRSPVALQACKLQWLREANRLAGNPAHLRALRVHLAAMRAWKIEVNA